jgi:hypothetical protein
MKHLTLTLVLFSILSLTQAAPQVPEHTHSDNSHGITSGGCPYVKSNGLKCYGFGRANGFLAGRQKMVCSQDSGHTWLE